MPNNKQKKEDMELPPGLEEVSRIFRDRENVELKREIARLKKELKLWKGTAEIPEVGKYYFTDSPRMKLHGLNFAHATPLRYDGCQTWSSKDFGSRYSRDGDRYGERLPTTLDWLGWAWTGTGFVSPRCDDVTIHEHIFTIPYRYEDLQWYVNVNPPVERRTGWIQFRLETFELHKIRVIRWENPDSELELSNQLQYLDSDDTRRVWDPFFSELFYLLGSIITDIENDRISSMLRIWRSLIT